MILHLSKLLVWGSGWVSGVPISSVTKAPAAEAAVLEEALASEGAKAPATAGEASARPPSAAKQMT